MPQGKIARIALFYLIAIAGSALTRLVLHTGQASKGSPWALYVHLLAGAGPALGALAVWLLTRRRSPKTLAGTNLRFALAMAAMPALVIALRGVPNPFQMEPHLFGLHMGISIALYALLEEIGWRGYLQDDLRPWPALARYAFIGVLWWAWHLSWLESHPLGSEITTIAFMILASIGIGFVADRTGSVLAAAAFHAAGDIMGLTTDFRTIIPDVNVRATIVAICVVVWIVLLRLWKISERRG